MLRGFVEHYSGGNSELVAFLFEKVSNDVRIQWLKKALTLRRVDARVLEAIGRFIEAYTICTDNRGLLIHSRVFAYRIRDNAVIASKRVRRTGAQQSYEFPLEVIRRVADETQYWSRYGSRVLSYLSRRRWQRRKRPKGAVLVGPKRLPDLPPVPMRLEPGPKLPKLP
jgi:hypothetical protein